MDALRDTLELCREVWFEGSGFLHSLESFSTLLGLQLSQKLSSVEEQVSLVRQKKSLTILDALSVVDTDKAYYSWQMMNFTIFMKVQ